MCTQGALLRSSSQRKCLPLEQSVAGIAQEQGTRQASGHRLLRNRSLEHLLTFFTSIFAFPICRHYLAYTSDASSIKICHLCCVHASFTQGLSLTLSFTLTHKKSARIIRSLPLYFHNQHAASRLPSSTCLRTRVRRSCS